MNFKMSAVDELLKNLMLRAGVQKSRKRARDTVCEDTKDYIPCRNTKTRQESSDIDSLSSEAKSTKQEAKDF